MPDRHAWAQGPFGVGSTNPPDQAPPRPAPSAATGLPALRNGAKVNATPEQTHSPQTLDSVRATVANVSFRDWIFRVDPLGAGFFIQVQWDGLDTDTGELCRIKGAKHYVSQFCIADEIIKRCWVAVEAALRHEAMEEFKVCGVAPFNPHNDVFAMLELPKVHRIQLNPEPVATAEANDA